LPIFVSTHPRTRKRLEEIGYQGLDPRIVFSKPLGFFDYMKLQMEARCVLSDSGTITEEASMLNLAAITIRNAHERPEGMDVGTLIMAGLKAERVIDAIEIVTSQRERQSQPVLPVADYENPHVSKQVVRVVASYVDYINRVVWSKS
jgi:UDP-N-acetylglucosamine 2-epimerase (non-hydrolysing)